MTTRFEVPNLVKRDLLTLYYSGDDPVDEAIAILKTKIKPNLSRVEEKELERCVRNWQSEFKQRKNKGRNTFERFLDKGAKWLSTPVTLPITFKYSKLPPPPTATEVDDNPDNFRNPSNYCLVCSSTALGECPPHLTRRLCKSICVAMKLISKEELEFERNLIGCILCPPCYEKVLEVNDGVVELEQIQANLQRISEDLDELLLDGITNQKNIPVEIHGVAPTYLTPVELRQEIVDSRKKVKEIDVPTKPKTPTTPFNITTRSFRNQPEVDSFCPTITSVTSISIPQPRRGRKDMPTVRSWPIHPDEPEYLSLDHTYDLPTDNEEEKIVKTHAETDVQSNHRYHLVTPPSFDPPSPTTDNPPNFTVSASNNAPQTTFVLSNKSVESGKLLSKAKARPLLPVPLRHLKCKIPGCGFRCNEADRLQGHINREHHNDPKPFKCNFAGCERIYKEYTSLRTHQKYSHGCSGQGRRAFKCDMCDRTYTRPFELRRHIQSAHPTAELSLPCTTCAKTFKSAEKLRNHVRVHASKEFICPSSTGCQKAFYYLDGLRTHQGKSHPTEFPEFVRAEPPPAEPVELICEECGKMETSVGRMKRHKTYKHKGKEAIPRKKNTRKCPVPNCDFKSDDAGEVRGHRLTHGVIQPTIPCSEPTCAQMFATKLQLQTHVFMVHNQRNPEKEFTCGRCGKEGFKSQHGLDTHDEVCKMQGRKDVLCGSCNMAFSTGRQLSRHNQSNPNCKPKEEGPRSVYCGTCGALCSSNNALARHIQLIHNKGTKPIQCPSCPKSFPIKMYLTRHLKESKYCPGSKGYIPPVGHGGTKQTTTTQTQQKTL